MGKCLARDYRAGLWAACQVAKAIIFSLCWHQKEVLKLWSHFAELPFLCEELAALVGGRTQSSSHFFVAASDPPFQYTANVHAEQKACIKGPDSSPPSKIPQPLLSLELGGYWALQTCWARKVKTPSEASRGGAVCLGDRAVHPKARRLPWHPDTEIIPYECHWGLWLKLFMSQKSHETTGREDDCTSQAVGKKIGASMSSHASPPPPSLLRKIIFK